MSRIGRVDLALTVAASLLVSGVALRAGRSWMDWVFGCFVLSALLVAARLVVSAWRDARDEHRRAEQLMRTLPAEVAGAAVADERRRLAEDISVCLRQALEAVARDVAQLEAVEEDPRPRLRRIQHHAREAASELRRQLGLLRGTEPDDARLEPAGEEAGPRLRRDLWLAAGATLLAVVETAAFLPTERPDAAMAWPMLLSALAAGTVAGRSLSPAGAAAACGAVYGLGTWLGAPVSGGLWTVLTVGSLAWTVAGRLRPGQLGWAGLLALWLGVAGSRWLSDPSNLEFVFAVLAVATVAGGLFARHHLRRVKADLVARSRADELRRVRDEAVAVERTAYARELHDVVSHAIGVVATQGGAAEVSWPQDPVAVRNAVEVIAATTRETLAELDRLLPAAEPDARTSTEVESLVRRISATGIEVRLERLGNPQHAELVYRIVQESLTNVLRHAPGARVLVRVSGGPEGTHVDVVDDGPGPGMSSRRGYGLIGLEERVALAGGVLRSGPAPDGAGFAVAAALPHDSEEAIR